MNEETKVPRFERDLSATEIKASPLNVPPLEVSETKVSLPKSPETEYSLSPQTQKIDTIIDAEPRPSEAEQIQNLEDLLEGKTPTSDLADLTDQLMK